MKDSIELGYKDYPNETEWIFSQPLMLLPVGSEYFELCKRTKPTYAKRVGFLSETYRDRVTPAKYKRNDVPLNDIREYQKHISKGFDVLFVVKERKIAVEDKYGRPKSPITLRYVLKDWFPRFFDDSRARDEEVFRINEDMDISPSLVNYIRACGFKVMTTEAFIEHIEAIDNCGEGSTGEGNRVWSKGKDALVGFLHDYSFFAYVLQRLRHHDNFDFTNFLRENA